MRVALSQAEQRDLLNHSLSGTLPAKQCGFPTRAVCTAEGGRRIVAARNLP